jgi:hypothetical protein
MSGSSVCLTVCSQAASSFPTIGERLFLQQIQQLVQAPLMDAQELVFAEVLMFEQWAEIRLVCDELLKRFIAPSIVSEKERPKPIRIVAEEGRLIR